MLGCWELRYVRNKCAWDTSLNNKNVSPTHRLYNMGVNNSHSEQLPNHNFFFKHIKIFAKVCPNGRPINNHLTLLIWLPRQRVVLSYLNLVVHDVHWVLGPPHVLYMRVADYAGRSFRTGSVLSVPPSFYS